MFLGHSVMSDKAILLANTFSQCYGRIVHFVCNINCCAKLRVGTENCVMSFEKVYSVLKHRHNQL